MESVGAYEAKTRLSQLLQQVAQGESVAITLHGREVARLVPSQPSPADPSRIIAEIHAMRKGVTRGRESVRRMIDEGRR